ncbi:MAG: T9SS type A sorting domain-containing protein [Saprospiraceae bacterium]|nr:T9SS type A sorting domain-containing protein [Saprospiraceae bacterium]
MTSNAIYGQEWVQVGNINNPIDHLYTDTLDNSLYVGGSFRFFNGTETRGIFRLDSAGQAHPLGSGQDGCGPYNCYPVKVITRYKDEIYIGWVPPTIGGGIVVNGIARWDGVQWKALQNGFNGAASTNGFWEHNGDLYIAGGFDVTIDSIVQYAIVKWDGDNWEGFAFPVYNNDYPIAQDAVWYKGKLYLGGGFPFPVDNSYILDIASFDGQGWSAVENGITGGGWHGIFDMEVYKDELYVCGTFRAVDGNIGNKIMRWNGEQWNDVGGGICDVNGTAHQMLIHKDKLYVIGIFTCVGNGIPASCIASWDGERWCSVGNSVFNNRITAIEFWNDELYVGGGFTEIDGQPVKFFAKWVGDHASDTCSAPLSAVQTPAGKERPGLRITPNPASGRVSLHIDEAYGPPLALRVYDTSGRQHHCVAGDNYGWIETGHLPPGLYWVQVVCTDGWLAERLVRM